MTRRGGEGADAPVLIRDERDGDHEAVTHIHRTSFRGPEEGALVTALRNEATPIVSLVALAGATPVGHILFSPITITTARPAAAGQPLRMGLAPLAVPPGHQRRGIGTKLIAVGLGRCRDLGAAGVVVLGDPGYYSRSGFVAAAEFGLRSKFTTEATAPAFQALELHPGGLSGLSPGAVHYHPAFDRL